MRITSHQRRGRRSLLGFVAPLVLAAVAALATSCVSGPSDAGGSGAGAADEGDITFWTINLKKNFGSYITGLIDSYQKSHPKVHVTWVDVPGKDIATKFLSSVASGDVPDVVNIDSANLGRFADQMVDLGKFVQPNELADYQPGLLNSLRPNGSLIALPWYNGGAPVGVYNMSIMSKVGFDPANPPKNYDEVLALGQQVYDKTKVYGTNSIPSYVNGETAVLSYEGIPMLTPDKKKAAFDTPAAVAVLNKFKKAYDSHAIAPGAISADTRNFPQSLDNQQIAFVPDGYPFVLTSLENNSPTVYKNLAITKPPTTKDGKYLLLGQQTLAVPARSQHQAAAAAFAKFVTNGANQLAFCKLVAIYPSTVSTTKDAFFTDKTDTSPIGKARQLIVSELPNLVDGQLGSGKDAELSDALSKQVRAFMQGSVSADQALATAADAWNKALSGQ
ncbi:ABC transporter substrate-binding protein [Labedaea rhizosphaerae]|uniref:Carbohydrate ABC transporter substrate-binding protein (CUT1 family) n=1 Tax=Labedaea rhizosphaerae TaxID=598644 RepID=A0A4V6PVR3_LABRH|nr:extracellular solute-binding protein [Labedaea rhizosphaerae]TDP94838.1 carbohydrate ABC transporter substrate-binding protein (CUT1 family) [Labedaea rhizosphaerae]